jgi:methylamine methyltransferase corrinoid protein reductive activase
MKRFGIALDLGTSGFRAQGIDLENDEIISTAITLRHPIPGANVMDHVNFALDTGVDVTHKLIIMTVNRLISNLKIDLGKVERLAVCGNPFQLSLLQNMEIRDLAYAGKTKLKSLGITPPRRDATIINARSIGINIHPDGEILIPPSVKHEIGADALAMMLKTDFLEREEPCLVTDYGTNAEMALNLDGKIYTGSAAAGPALEGQQIKQGMLAAPGAISDIDSMNSSWLCSVLNEELIAERGDLIDPFTGSINEKGIMHGNVKGITGTGVVAAIAQGLREGVVVPPKIKTPDNKIHLQDGIVITEEDVVEAGKAMGAIRAGHLTLMYEAGIQIEEVKSAYMAGALGTYVDARKAQEVGLVPSLSTRLIQVGNTSLALARDLVTIPDNLDELQDFANKLRAKHVMFAISKTFKNIYIVELSLWTEGMPFNMYNEMMDLYNLPPLPMKKIRARVNKIVDRDIPNLGKCGITVLEDIGINLHSRLSDCILCKKCMKECPEDAIIIKERDNNRIAIIRSDRCSGTACRRCEITCPKNTLKLKDMEIL